MDQTVNLQEEQQGLITEDINTTSHNSDSLRDYDPAILLLPRGYDTGEVPSLVYNTTTGYTYCKRLGINFQINHDSVIIPDEEIDAHPELEEYRTKHSTEQNGHHDGGTNLDWHVCTCDYGPIVRGSSSDGLESDTTSDNLSTYLHGSPSSIPSHNWHGTHVSNSESSQVAGSYATCIISVMHRGTINPSKADKWKPCNDKKCGFCRNK